VQANGGFFSKDEKGKEVRDSSFGVGLAERGAEFT